MSDNFGQTIREAREKRGWSQEFLAAKVGATQSTIDRIESGLTQRSRVLPEIASILNLQIPGITRTIQQPPPVAGLVKVSYVLPQELVERVSNYKLAVGVSSDDEAVRRLIDDQLKKRDQVEDIVDRLLVKYKSIRSMREAAGYVLANHPLIKSIEFDGEHVVFVLENNLLVEVSAWGRVFVRKPDGHPYLYHKSTAPRWALEENITEDLDQANAPPF